MFKQKLVEYKDFTDMTNERIDKLYLGLSNRISNLIKYKKLESI